jgi:leucyl-tRNA---protein transferase
MRSALVARSAEIDSPLTPLRGRLVQWTRVMSRAVSHERRTRLLARAIARQSQSPGEAFACPYIAGRRARHLVVGATTVPPGLYHSLMDLNFRRLGPVFYRPTCDDCQECRMLRVPVQEFKPSRAQRRCLAANEDVTIEIGPPVATEEKRRLYQSYLEARHDGQMDGSPTEFEGFLYTSSVETLEFVYRLGDRVVGVGIADLEPLALSAVYFYFDPAASHRSLGVFNVLRLIEECRIRGRSHLYLGYYVQECRKMSYKAAYRPCEVLRSDRRWVRLDFKASASPPDRMPTVPAGSAE